MKRVLIIDDAAFMRMMIKAILVKNGFEVVGEAENGAVGVQQYMELKPDLVTLDITMPELDGIGALKIIKAQDPNAKVAMVSAMGQESFVREAIICGAKTFLVKPFKEDKVIEEIRKICR